MVLWRGRGTRWAHAHRESARRIVEPASAPPSRDRKEIAASCWFVEWGTIVDVLDCLVAKAKFDHRTKSAERYPGPGELRETHCDLTLIGLPSPTDTRLWPELGNEALLRFAGCAAAFADRACRPRRNSRRGSSRPSRTVSSRS